MRLFTYSPIPYVGEREGRGEEREGGGRREEGKKRANSEESYSAESSV